MAWAGIKSQKKCFEICSPSLVITMALAHQEVRDIILSDTDTRAHGFGERCVLPPVWRVAIGTFREKKLDALGMALRDGNVERSPAIVIPAPASKSRRSFSTS
jgi:hypothetical protein